MTVATKRSGYAVISGGNFTGAVHPIRKEIGTSGTTRKAWIVNSHLDLRTWNKVYYMTEDELDNCDTGVVVTGV
jgi:hypothetical protein